MSPPPAKLDRALDATRILDAAFVVLDGHGFGGLTIRRIAEELGVKNPALYWHFRNKQEIVDGMAGRLLDRLVEMPFQSGDWRSWLKQSAKWYRQTLLSVRDGAEILSNANLSHTRHFAEFRRGIERLTNEGFAAHDAVLGMVTVFDYALGVTYEHQADAAIEEPPPEDVALFAPLGAASRDDAREAMFDGGLDLILDGLTLRRN